MNPVVNIIIQIAFSILFLVAAGAIISLSGKHPMIQNQTFLNPDHNPLLIPGGSTQDGKKKVYPNPLAIPGSFSLLYIITVLVYAHFWGYNYGNVIVTIGAIIVGIYSFSMAAGSM